MSTAVQRAPLINPYWETVQTFPNSDLRWSKNRFEPDAYPYLTDSIHGRREYDQKNSRSHLVTQYAWAIPNDETIMWLAERFAGQHFVEIGAGKGYWAYLLEQVGIAVTCYDEKLIALGEDNHWFKDSGTETFHVILRGDATVTARHPDKVLFLCWPPYDGTMAIDSLRAYQGDTLVYVGEGEGGCCADDSFFAELATNWEEAECCEAMTQWGGMHDWLWIYRRKNPSLIKEEP